ncbi:hypothetical protein D3C74_286370 [compost metagenome]
MRIVHTPAFCPTGYVQHITTQLAAYVLQDLIRISAGAIDFVDKEKRRNPVGSKQLPYRLRMSFDTFHRADDDDRVIEHLQRSFHLCGEIDVTGRVQQKIRRFAVFHFGLISENGDPTRFLNFVTVEKSVAVVDPASIADRLRMVQQSLGKGRFAGVDMRQQSYRFIHGCSPAA